VPNVPAGLFTGITGKPHAAQGIQILAFVLLITVLAIKNFDPKLNKP